MRIANSRFLLKLSILLLTLGLGLIVNLYAADVAPSAKVQTVAQVVWVKGSIKAVSVAKEERELKRGDQLYEHETLVTAPKASGQIVFTDSALLALNADSVVSIDQYAFNKGTKPKDEKYVLNLVKGGFRTIAGEIEKTNPEAYKINTPVATLSSRGTTFSVCYGCVPSVKPELAVKIDQGIVEVKNDAGVVVITPAASSVAIISGKDHVATLLKSLPEKYHQVFSEIPVIQRVPAPKAVWTQHPSYSGHVIPGGGTPPTSGGGTPPPAGGGKAPVSPGVVPKSGVVNSFCIGG